MSKITRRPTADDLYSKRGTKPALDKALAEARDLAHWAGRRIPNGPTSGFMTQGYVIGHTGDLDLAIAQIIARVREETLADFITRNSVSHVARFTPGVFAAGTLRKADEYATPKMAHESRAERNRRQLAVRKSGKCDSCGAEFVDSTPAFAPGPAKRTRKQWAAAISAVRKSAAAKEKIPSHNESPTGALRGTPKGRSRK